MTAIAMTAGSRILWAALAFAGAVFFGLYAIGQPLWFLTSGVPVNPSLAVAAWAGPLAGLPMFGLASYALSVLIRPPVSQVQREALAARCFLMGLWGMGLGALWAGSALAGALALHGQAGATGARWGIELPMIAILVGLFAVVTINLLRMRTGQSWTALGHIVWGFLGVVALAVGLPMLAEAASIDDARTLKQRFNLFVVFYPLLWLAFVAMAAAVTICGVRWLRFGLSEPHRNEVSPPSTGSTWPVTYEDSPEIMNKAA